MPVEMGEHSYGEAIRISPYDGLVVLGKFCSIASGVNALFLRDHHTDWITTYPFHIKWGLDVPKQEVIPGKIKIENDVWIGTGVTLMGGCSIGSGCVIGAFSVVAGRIPPYSIAVGNPCRIIRKRFSDEQISSLLKIKWWDWPEEKIRKYAHLLSDCDIERFLNEISSD